RSRSLWMKDGFSSGSHVCLRGAFIRAMGVEPMNVEEFADTAFEYKCAAYPFVAEAISEIYPTIGGRHWQNAAMMSTFNDASDTNHADVLAVLDRAYQLAGERQ